MHGGAAWTAEQGVRMIFFVEITRIMQWDRVKWNRGMRVCVCVWPCTLVPETIRTRIFSDIYIHSRLHSKWNVSRIGHYTEYLIQRIWASGSRSNVSSLILFSSLICRATGIIPLDPLPFRVTDSNECVRNAYLPLNGAYRATWFVRMRLIMIVLVVIWCGHLAR